VILFHRSVVVSVMNIFTRTSLMALALVACLHGQNLDLLESTPSAFYRSLGGAGIALGGEAASAVLNPASLVLGPDFQAMISGFLSHHRYHLVNERHEESLTRIFKWQANDYGLAQVQFSARLLESLCLGLGYENRVRPFLFNQRRAITWSPLYNQRTAGSIGGPFVALSYRPFKAFSTGLLMIAYRSSVRTEIHGENHGNDTDKWAWAEHSFSGVDVKLGFVYMASFFQVALTLEPGVSPPVKTITGLSDEGLYAGLLPADLDTKFNSPNVITLGSALSITPDLKWVVDLRWQDFSVPDARINLYEYGGPPQDGRLWSLHTGLALSQSNIGLPLRLGYARQPQVYAATEKAQPPGEPASLSSGAKNIQHTLSDGTSKALARGVVHFALDYRLLSWDGDLFTYITITDDYTERAFEFSVAWVMGSSSLSNPE
jgi:hypothetical protein